jgi:hypothetical protein
MVPRLSTAPERVCRIDGMWRRSHYALGTEVPYLTPTPVRYQTEDRKSASLLQAASVLCQQMSPG